VPDDHPVREIAAVVDLSWVHSDLAPYYPRLGRPSIDPVLMIRMLIIGYVFAIRSERALFRVVRVNLAYRWFCGLSIEDKISVAARAHFSLLGHDHRRPWPDVRITSWRRPGMGPERLVLAARPQYPPWLIRGEPGPRGPCHRKPITKPSIAPR
jgi:Transposase domain (DUF772)